MPTPGTWCINRKMTNIIGFGGLPMDKDDIRRKFSEISIWKRGAERAPHKPLLLLLSLAKCASNEDRLIPYLKVDKELGVLLREFGPTRKSYHPEYPFWWLRSDGIWELVNAENVETRKNHSNPRKSELNKYHGEAAIFSSHQ